MNTDTIVFQMFQFLGVDKWLLRRNFRWYKKLAKVNSEEYKQQELKVSYYMLGRMILSLLRSQTYNKMVEDFLDDNVQEVMLSSDDIEMLHTIREGVITICELESWDRSSVIDSALHKILTRRKLTNNPELMKKFSFIKSFSTSQFV